MPVHRPHSVHLIRGQFAGVGFLHLPRGSQGSNSVHQTEPLAAGASIHGAILLAP